MLQNSSGVIFYRQILDLGDISCLKWLNTSDPAHTFSFALYHSPQYDGFLEILRDSYCQLSTYRTRYTSAMHATRRTPFRLLDLPQEIQDRVYEKYFGECQPSVHFFSVSDREYHTMRDLDIKGIPNLAIERVSRKVGRDAREARERSITTTIVLQGTKQASEGDMLHRTALANRMEWLRSRATCVRLENGWSVANHEQEYSWIMSRFPQLRSIVVTFERTSPFDKDRLHKLLKGDRMVTDVVEEAIVNQAVGLRGLPELAFEMAQQSRFNYSITSHATIFFKASIARETLLVRKVCAKLVQPCNVLTMLMSV